MTLPARTTRGSLGRKTLLAVGEVYEFQNLKVPANARELALYVRTDRGITVTVERLSTEPAAGAGGLGDVGGKRRTVPDLVIPEPPPADEQVLRINDGAPPLGEYVVTVTNTSNVPGPGGVSGEIIIEATWGEGDAHAWPYAE